MADVALRDKVKSLDKAVKDDVLPATIIKMLQELKNMPAPPEPVIRSSGGGKVVGNLRSHKNKEIASVAASIVRKWKEAVDKSKKMAVNGGTASPRPKGSGTASPAPQANLTSSDNTRTLAASTPKVASPGYTGDASKRNWRIDKVSTDKTDSKPRNGSIGLMYNALAYKSTLPSHRIIERAIEIERAAHEIYTGETKAYNDKMRYLFANLKSETHAKLRSDLLEGNKRPQDFVKMTQEDLKSAELKKTEETLEKENMRTAQVAMPEKSVSDALTCGKCGKKQVAYTQAQTRSADEPMTTFCECLVCGNRWKFS